MVALAFPTNGRPAHGLCIPGHVRTVLTADHLIVDLVGGCEIDLFLLGVVPADEMLPRKRRRVFAAGESEFEPRELTSACRLARDHVAKLVAPIKTPTIWIPQPNFDREWIRTVRPNSRHAGVLYLDDHSPSLNERIKTDHIWKTDSWLQQLPGLTFQRSNARRPTRRAA